MRSPSSLCILLAVAACGGASRAPLAGAPAGDTGFAALRDRTVEEIFAVQPELAVELGLHEHDGRLTDKSRAGLASLRARYRAADAALAAVAPASLSATARAERAALRAHLAGALFVVEATRSPFRNPLYYAGGGNLVEYVVRDYAPLDDRARAVLKYVAAARKNLAAAEENLGEPMPRPWLETAIAVNAGSVAFVEGDVRKLFAGVSDAALRKQVDDALVAHAADLRKLGAFLESKKGTATSDYAIGAELYLRGLADLEGLATDLATLKKLADADLARNLAALDEAARQIDPHKTTAQVVAEVAADRPSPEEVVALATRQAEETRRFLQTHPLVSIPSDDVAEVRLSPPFSRFNSASLSAAGVFESRPLPSFYYITPPDPAWPPEQQQAYLAPRHHLLFTTVHELWPGHFLQWLYSKKQPSRVLKAFCSYANVEGWGHYVEEMMWDAGLGGGDPRVRIGMLLSALMRNARFVVALGLHTGGMSVDEATRVFQEKAFMPLAGARQQAVRGTFDPFYSSYTLGKLMIVKLRDDWKAKLEAEGKGKDYSLQAFHETFLGQGCQAVPLIREVMVGGGAAL